MKLRNVLISLFIIVISLFSINVKADSTIPQAVNFSGSTAKSLKGNDYLGYGSTLNFTYKETTGGEVAYCTEIHDDWFYSGYEAFYLTGKTSDKYAYIMANGYPNKSITGDKYKDYYITGLAIWYIINPNDVSFTNFDLSNGTYKGHPSDVVKEVAKLVYGANNYSAKETSINITNASNFALSSDKKYYVSTITVNSSNLDGNYKASLTGAPEGSIITDNNGNESNSFSGASFLVKVPVSSIKSLSNTMSVSVSGSGTIYSAYLYKPSAPKNNLQNVTILFSEPVSVTDKVDLNLNITTKVEITKEDATTGKELEGAHLVVKDSKGKVRDEWDSKKDEVHVINDLEPGKYTLTETMAPEGYIKSEETVEFVVKADGTVTKAVMKNYPEKPKTVYISKQDATTGEELEGAYLEIKNEAGDVVEAWISETTPHKVVGLEPGKYTLTETIAPEGYELSKETVTFVVKEDGTTDGTVIMYNKPEEVEVPSTSSFKTITASLIGLIIIGFGSMIIYKNYKKNEEN